MNPIVNADASFSHKIVPGDSLWPNNLILPVLYYKQVLKIEPDTEKQVKEMFGENGWTHAWVDSIYHYHHYHSTAHEVLAIVKGTCMLQLGGEDGSIQDVAAGDVIVIPAGVVHKNVGSSDDLTVVGAYPNGQECDLNKGGEERKKVDKNISKVELPTGDPVFGETGPLKELWEEADNPITKEKQF